MLTSSSIAKLSPFHEKSDFVNVIVDTPKGAPYKLKFEEGTGIFRVHKALPSGSPFLSTLASCPPREQATAIRSTCFC